ncbi:hypothetical protein F2Q69_00023834 [Brassica cretica]|uniref:Uncharacterized protein n=1 Tax=Brassica cretica TaxID=69181 RepID=A0A8S9QK45_BRACR|nr:hypothetical protein F2Q69_00023834 [Brassica cretica]
MLNKTLRSVEDDCCSVILKDNSDDFQEVFFEVLHSRRIPGSRKMDLPELPLRIHTLGEEPPAAKSISYHTDDSKLFAALRQALHADEYEELKESKLEDTAAENIIKVMFNAKPRWKWTMDGWEVTGTKPNVKK